jgi:hypothetical protein
VAPAAARIAAMIAGPAVKLISIVTASSAKAVRRSSSRSNFCRHTARVSVVIGVAKAPAHAAAATTNGNARPSFTPARIAMSASGWSVPVNQSRRAGPWRSMMRPWIGAATAAATKFAPTAVPASAKLPSDSRRNMSIEKPTMPTGMRVTTATASRRATSGCRTNSEYLRRMLFKATGGAARVRLVARAGDVASVE